MTAISGCNAPLDPYAKKNWNTIRKLKLTNNPIPKFNPIPPLVFLEETLTPIIVRIIMAKGIANRLYFSVM